MSIKVIQNLKGYSIELLENIKTNNSSQINKLLKEINEENTSELSIAKEFNINYLLSLHSTIAEQINIIKTNISNPEMMTASTNNIINLLKNVVDQREVRDKLIAQAIQPFLKNLGYKQNKRSFVKEENGFVKKIKIYTSKVCDYYNVQFIFEIDLIGNGIKQESKRVNQKWFELTQDTNYEKISIEIKKQLITQIIPYLNSYK